MYRTPKCSCLHLFFSALHTKRQQHAEPIIKQDLINTNPKHAGEEINKVLRNQEVKWCQSRRVHSKCSSKFVNNNFYLKRSIYTFLQGAGQPASVLRWTYSDLLYSVFMTLKGKSRHTRALSAMPAQTVKALGSGTSTFSSRCQQKAHCAAAEIVPDENEPAPKPERSVLYREAS